jgi:preprotein translocase subunit SecG
METTLLVVHILVALGIIGLVLIQHGKGADAGAAFGAGAAGGASGTVFGAKGSSNFLSRSTAMLATVFFLTSLSLAYLAKSEDPTRSLMEKAEQAPAVQTAPADTTDAPVVPEQLDVTDSPEKAQ